MSGENNSQDLLVKVQKKVLGKMVGKNSIKLVVDDNISVVLDDFYKWAKVNYVILFLDFKLPNFPDRIG